MVIKEEGPSESEKDQRKNDKRHRNCSLSLGGNMC